MTDIPRRIDRLQARIDAIAGLILPSEAAELAILEADRDAMFSGEIDTWDEPKLDAYLAYCASETAGRVGALRAKMRTPAQIARDAAAEAEIAAMTADEVDALLERYQLPQENDR